MERRSPTLELLRLALPMIGMMVSRQLVNFIDTFMVSMLGTTAQAAIAPSTILLFTISCLGMGGAQSIQTFVSQADGRGAPHLAGSYAWQSLYLGLVMGVLAIPLIVTVPTWVGAIGGLSHAPPEIERLEVDFLSIALWFVAPATVTAGLESFYNGIGKPRVALMAILASLASVIVGNYVLIFGHAGFPAMGIRGAAISTVLSWVVRMAVLLVPLFWKELDERYRTRRDWRPRLGRLRELIGLGWPISLQWLVDIGAWSVVLAILIPRFGAVQMAAATIALQYMHVSFMPGLGVGMALTTQVGNAIGAGQPDLAVDRVKVARRLIVAWMGFVGLVFLFAGKQLAHAWIQFEPDAPAELAIATAKVLVWCGVWQVFDALCITYSFALRGAGDTRVPTLLFAGCCWGIFITGGWAITHFAPGLGAPAIWSAGAAYITVLGLLLQRRWRGGVWRTIQLSAA
jgi:multidrug resistance protein, MATE family